MTNVLLFLFNFSFGLNRKKKIIKIKISHVNKLWKKIQIFKINVLTGIIDSCKNNLKLTIMYFIIISLIFTYQNY